MDLFTEVEKREEGEFKGVSVSELKRHGVKFNESGHPLNNTEYTKAIQYVTNNYSNKLKK